MDKWSMSGVLMGGRCNIVVVLVRVEGERKDDTIHAVTKVLNVINSHRLYRQKKNLVTE